MATLDETRQLMQQLVPKFYPQSDLNTIKNAFRLSQQLQENNSRKLNQSKEAIKSLQRKTEVIKWEAQRPADNSEEQFSESMAEYEREKFQLAKQINDLDLQIEDLEAQISRTSLQITNTIQQTTEHEDVDELSLLLSIYRGLGVQWISTGDVVKCRVREERNNDVHTVTFDEKYDDYFYTNYIWDLTMASN